MENKLSRIKNLSSYSILLCMMVVLIHDHIPHYYDYSTNPVNNTLHFLMVELIPKITAIAVPSFFILSGFLFFRNYTLENTLNKYKSRFHSLFIPYLLWNLVGLLFEMITRIPLFANMGQVNSNPFLPKSIFYGVFLHQYTILWFVFALLIYVLLAPIVYVLIKNRYVGFVILLVIFTLIGFNILVIHLPNGCYFETSSLFYYLVGAFLGMHYKNFYSIKANLLSFLLSVFSFISIIILELSLDQSLGEWSMIILLVKSYAFWIICSYLSPYIVEKGWFQYSFFIYVLHLNIIRGVSAIIRVIFRPFSSYVGVEFLQYLFTFIITLILCICFANLLRKYSLKTYNIVSGNR